MADASSASLRSLKFLLFGLALFVVGGFLFGLSYVIYALGSRNGDIAAITGVGFMVVGIIVAGIELWS